MGIKPYIGYHHTRTIVNSVLLFTGSVQIGHMFAQEHPNVAFDHLCSLCLVNDLPDKIKTKCLMFADDLKLFRQIRSVEDSEFLQADLDYLTQCTAGIFAI